MANTTETIAGSNGLVEASNAEIDTGVSVPVDVGPPSAPTATRRLSSLANLRRALGLLTFDASGDVKEESPGYLNLLKLVLQNGKVTLAKLADMPTNQLLGRVTAGTGVPELIAIGTGLTLSGGSLNADAVSQTPPSTNLLVYRRYGKF